MKQTYLLIILGLISSACSIERRNAIEQIVDDYYITYDNRKDIDRFIGFYDDNILLEDIINGDRIEGKEELKNFLDWNNPKFKIIGNNSLILSEKIIQQDKVVVKGHFTRFQWDEIEFESMHFTTILTFNESDKIIKQVDWINYPANLVNYNERKNSNDWIK